jgi:hypothetical protein
MPPNRPIRAYQLRCDDGSLFLIYNASAFGNPPDHVLNKWYFLRYPFPRVFRAGEAFDTADEAETAARASIAVATP